MLFCKILFSKTFPIIWLASTSRRRCFDGSRRQAAAEDGLCDLHSREDEKTTRRSARQTGQSSGQNVYRHDRKLMT
jgi:predicted RNA polymerase sigma factor